MTKFYRILISIIFILGFNNISLSKENFFNEGLKLFKNKKYDDAKFLLERSIVFNPKHSNSYLYLAKIYETEENEIEEEKNLNTTLLLDPNNEEAIYMLINIKLEKSDIKKVKELTEKFQIICETLCSKLNSIDERLSNIDVNNES